MKDIHDRIADLERDVEMLKGMVGKPPEEQPHRQTWPQERAGRAEDLPARAYEPGAVDEEEAERVGS